MGYRRFGWQQFGIDPALHLLRSSYVADALASYITAFPDDLDQGSLAGSYGAGLIHIKGCAEKSHAPAGSVSHPDFPASADPPMASELSDMLRDTSRVAVESRVGPLVVPLQDDWLTEGAWLGRCGKFWAWLAAIDDPEKGYLWGAGPETLDHGIVQGDFHRKTDYFRYWIAQDFYTDDYRALEIPPVYMHSRVVQGLTTWKKDRRMAEWNDNGSTYPATAEGPGLDIHLQVPDGTFALSLYEVNDDAHTGARNRYRDFQIEISDEDAASSPLENNQKPSADPAVLCRSRVSDFWAGVYKRFLVKGPVNLKIAIKRDFSYNTIFNAVMLDLPDERPVGYFQTVGEWQQVSAARAVQALQAGLAGVPAMGSMTDRSAQSEAAMVHNLLDRVDRLRELAPQWYAENQNRITIELARWCHAHEGAPDVSVKDEGTAYYRSGLYQAWEDCETRQHLTTARQIEKSLRWDGITDDNSGKGYQTIQNYLATTHR